MDELAGNFIEKFHSLPGITVKEKQQNLFRLFNENRKLLNDAERLKVISANLTPRSHLERIFFVDFLVYFKRFEELYQMYLIGDEIVSAKVAKQKWFFHKVVKSVDPEDFVNKILSTVSYSTKLKILRRLPFTEEESDAIFDAVVQRYGVFLATVILCKCSVEKIENILKSNLIKLTPSQLKLLYDKNPNLIIVYFEERSKHEGKSDFINNNPILVYIAQKNPEIFSELFHKYEFQTSLGNRTTKKYINSQKNKILDQPASYLKILKQGRVIRKLGGDLKYLLFKNVPSSKNLYWKNLLQYYPKNRRFELFRSVYNLTFHRKFGEDVEVIDEDMLKVVTEHVEREKIAKQKLKTEEDDKYLKYVSSQFCLKEFKEKLSQMVASERVRMVEIVTKCCILNEDLDALLKMCEMVAVRFKNDSSYIRCDFMYSFTDHLDIVEKFSEQHWKFILEIIAKAEANNEPNNYSTMQFMYLEYLMRNGKPIKEMVAKWKNLIIDIQYVYIWYKPKVLRTVLCAMFEMGCKKFYKQEDADVYDGNLAYICKQFNKKYPNLKINIFDNRRILESVKRVLKKNVTSFWVDTGIQYVICQKNPSELVREIQKLYCENLELLDNGIDVHFWLLKNEPRVFLDNLDNLLKHVDSCNTQKLWRLAKKYTHLNIEKKIVENFSAKLTSDDEIVKKELIKALAILSSPENHLELVKTYVPKSASVDLTVCDEIKKNYSLQCALVRFLHYVNLPETVLPVVLQFCKGDYLKFALGPLYSSLYKLPESRVKSVLEKINRDKGVAMRKHAVFLGCVLLDKISAYDCLKNATVNALVPTVKYLARNSSDSVWDLVKTNLIKLEKRDLQVIKHISKITLPLEYKVKYVEIVWMLANKHENLKLQNFVTDKIDKQVIQNLNSEFVYNVIEKSVFKIEQADLISTLLIGCENKNFEFISRILKDFKENQWNSKQLQLTARRKLYSFIQSLFRTYMKLKEHDHIFASKFLQVFNSVFSLVEAFEEFILVSCMELKGKDCQYCAKFLVEYSNKLIRDFSKSVISSLANTVKEQVIPYLFKTEYDKIRFVYYMFKLKQSVDDYLLIIKLLPLKEPQYSDEFKLYDEIMSDLEENTDAVVCLELNLYLSSMRKNVSDCEIYF